MRKKRGYENSQNWEKERSGLWLSLWLSLWGVVDSFVPFGYSVVGLGLGQGIGSMMGLVLVRQRAHGRCVGPPLSLSFVSPHHGDPTPHVLSLSLSLC